MEHRQHVEHYAKMILGYYHAPNEGDSMMGHLFLEQVRYPMTVEKPSTEEYDHVLGGTVTLASDDDLRRWAEAMFEEHEVWIMPIQGDPELDPTQRGWVSPAPDDQ